MRSSGTTAIATSSAAAVVALAADPDGHADHEVMIVNGAVAGFVSIDNQRTWCRLPASVTLIFDLRHKPHNAAVYIKRDGATDVVGVYVAAY